MFGRTMQQSVCWILPILFVEKTSLSIKAFVSCGVWQFEWGRSQYCKKERLQSSFPQQVVNRNPPSCCGVMCDTVYHCWFKRNGESLRPKAKQNLLGWQLSILLNIGWGRNLVTPKELDDKANLRVWRCHSQFHQAVSQCLWLMSFSIYFATFWPICCLSYKSTIPSSLHGRLSRANR